MFMPMFKTAIFLVIIWCCYFYPSHGCLEEERTHLLQIKDSINYPHGSSLDEDWVGKNCCNWYGIECNSSSSRVISIKLYEIREGRLGLWNPNASLFAAFKELKELDLSRNHIGGWVTPQGICELKNLRDLDLCENNLDGRTLPPCLSNLSKLETLMLSENDLGSYSSALTGLCGLSTLKSLDLSMNHLDDNSLPMCVGNFSLLETLDLYGNNLSGHFGNSISGLKRLQSLDLGSNQLADDGIFPWISNLTSLAELDLGDNKLKGSDTIKGLKRLQLLDLESNQLTDGGISPWISNLTSLTELRLGDNKLKGSDTIKGLCGLSSLSILYLSDNYLSSLPMCMGNFSLLEKLHLSQNNLNGLFGSSVPGLKQLTSLQLGSNQLTDDSISPWISNLTSLTELWLGTNKLKGLDTMRGLCGLSGLRDLYLSDNYLNGFPTCMGNLSLLEDLDLSINNLSTLFGNSIPGLKQLDVLDLGSNQLTDDGISPWISNLTSLTELYLSNNKLKGSDTIRGLCGLSGLRDLYLADNYLSGLPICMGNFSLLQVLILSRNNLSSLFDNSIPGLKQLDVLDLQSNQLTDDGISPWISNLTSLTELYLENNKLKGSETMRGFCKLRNLDMLDVEGNSFECNIHPCFGNMHHLSYLNLPRNQFKGTIPPSIFGNLTILEFISISQNQFSGVISFSVFANLSELLFVDLSENTQLEVETECLKWFPTFQLYHLLLNNCILNKRSNNHIPSFISTQHMLKTLNLGHTFLQGTIPSWLLYSVTIEYLNLRGNSLKGSFLKSTDHNKSMLYELDISDNKFFGELPPNMDTLFPNLVLLNMSTNELQGVIPLSIGKLQNLRTLDLSQNKLSGEMPQRLTRNNTSLKFLKLSNNKLQGNILSKYSNLTELVVLLLDNNEFTGTIISIHSPSLIILDLRENHLSGFIPSWLPSLPNLALLLLGRNFFDSSIPTELCQLQNLHILDLSYNKISGSIPSCLSNISSWMKEIPLQIDKSLGPQLENFMSTSRYMSTDISFTRIKTNLTIKGAKLTYEGIPISLITGIDLSMNQLKDSIPFQMGNLKELRFLNLSHNNLSGPFPESFINLENIESLDLSHNKLAGMIPPQIVRLHSISTFSVAFNNLSGAIPFEKQFSTFKESSYVGNHDLCGQPLQRNCSSNNQSQTQNGEGEEDDKSGILDHPMFFYLLVTISYALGFWSFIALICNKNRRQKLFRIVDRYYD